MAKVWIIENQLARRNVPPHAKIELALQRTDILAKREQAKAHIELGRSLGGGDRKSEAYQNRSLSTWTTSGEPTPAITPINVRAEVAKAAGVGVGTVARYEVVRAQASPEQMAKLHKGDATINQGQPAKLAR